MIEYSNISVTDISTTEPVTLPEAKEWLRIDFADDDDLLTSMITGARQSLEKFLNIALVDKHVSFDVSGLEGENVRLLYGGGTLTIEDIETETPVTDFVTRSANLKLGYDGNFGISYDVTASVPQAIKEAILMEVAERYNHRGDDGEGLSKAAQDKAAPFVSIWL